MDADGEDREAQEEKEVVSELADEGSDAGESASDVRRPLVTRLLGSIVKGVLKRRSESRDREDEEANGETKSMVASNLEHVETATPRDDRGQVAESQPSVFPAPQRMTTRRTSKLVTTTDQRSSRIGGPEEAQMRQAVEITEVKSRTRLSTAVPSTRDQQEYPHEHDPQHPMNESASIRTNQTVHNSEDSRPGSVKTENIDIDNIDTIDVDRLTYKQLQQICKHHHLAANGRKAMLKTRIRAKQKKLRSELEDQIAREKRDDRSVQRQEDINRSTVMDEEDEMSRVDTSMPQRREKLVHTSRKRDRNIDSIEPFVGDELSGAKSQDGIVLGTAKEQTSNQHATSGLDYVVEVSRAAKRGRKSISASEFEHFARVLLDSVPDLERDRALSNLTRLYETSTPGTKQKTENLIVYAQKASSGGNIGEQPPTAAQAEIRAEFTKDVPDVTTSVQHANVDKVSIPADRTKEENIGAGNQSDKVKVAVGHAVVKSPEKPTVAAVSQQTPCTPVVALDFSSPPKNVKSTENKVAKPAEVEGEPDTRMTVRDNRPAVEVQNISVRKPPSGKPQPGEISRKAQQSTESIFEAFLQKSSTFIPRPVDDEEILPSSFPNVFQGGFNSERPSRIHKRQQGLATLRRWRQRDDARASANVPVSYLSGVDNSYSTIAQSSTSKRILETLQRLSTPRVGSKRGRQQSPEPDFVESREQQLPQKSANLSGRDKALPGRSLRLHIEDERPTRLGQTHAEEAPPEESRLQRIRRQALSRMTAAEASKVEAARDKLSEALDKKNRSNEKSVKFSSHDEAAKSYKTAPTVGLNKLEATAEEPSQKRRRARPDEAAKLNEGQTDGNRIPSFSGMPTQAAPSSFTAKLGVPSVPSEPTDKPQTKAFSGFPSTSFSPLTASDTKGSSGTAVFKPISESGFGASPTAAQPPPKAERSKDAGGDDGEEKRPLVAVDKQVQGGEAEKRQETPIQEEAEFADEEEEEEELPAPVELNIPDSYKLKPPAGPPPVISFKFPTSDSTPAGTGSSQLSFDKPFVASLSKSSNTGALSAPSSSEERPTKKRGFLESSGEDKQVDVSGDAAEGGSGTVAASTSSRPQFSFGSSGAVFSGLADTAAPTSQKSTFPSSSGFTFGPAKTDEKVARAENTAENPEGEPVDVKETAQKAADASDRGSALLPPTTPGASGGSKQETAAHSSPTDKAPNVDAGGKRVEEPSTTEGAAKDVGDAAPKPSSANFSLPTSTEQTDSGSKPGSTGVGSLFFGQSSSASTLQFGLKKGDGNESNADGGSEAKPAFSFGSASSTAGGTSAAPQSGVSGASAMSAFGSAAMPEAGTGLSSAAASTGFQFGVGSSSGFTLSAPKPPADAAVSTFGTDGAKSSAASATQAAVFGASPSAAATPTSGSTPMLGASSPAFGTPPTAAFSAASSGFGAGSLSAASAASAASAQGFASATVPFGSSSAGAFGSGPASGFGATAPAPSSGLPAAFASGSGPSSVFGSASAPAFGSSIPAQDPGASAVFGTSGAFGSSAATSGGFGSFAPPSGSAFGGDSGSQSAPSSNVFGGSSAPSFSFGAAAAPPSFGAGGDKNQGAEQTGSAGGFGASLGGMGSAAPFGGPFGSGGMTSGQNGGFSFGNPGTQSTSYGGFGSQDTQIPPNQQSSGMAPFGGLGDGQQNANFNSGAGGSDGGGGFSMGSGTTSGRKIYRPRRTRR